MVHASRDIITKRVQAGGKLQEVSEITVNKIDRKKKSTLKETFN